VPTINRFFGITVRLYYDDHAPPRLHAYDGEDAASIEIDTLAVREGRLPKQAMSLIMESAADHRDELREDWRLAEAHQPLNRRLSDEQ
jgi:hypothetical protein